MKPELTAENSYIPGPKNIRHLSTLEEVKHIIIPQAVESITKWLPHLKGGWSLGRLGVGLGIGAFGFPVANALAQEGSDQAEVTSIEDGETLETAGVLEEEPVEEQPEVVQPTPTPTLTPTPRPTETTVPLGPVTFNWDIGPGVPAVDVQLIQEAVSFGRPRLQVLFGGDILGPAGIPVVIKIVATGQGNQEPGGERACCTAYSGGVLRPFFDVRHPHWTGSYWGDLGRKISAMHEALGHGFENSYGCQTHYSQPLGGWLDEGIASFIPTEIMVRDGILNNQVERYFFYRSAKSTGQLDVPLQSLENSPDLWPGHVGYLAIERLVSQAPTRNLSLKTLCGLVDAGLPNASSRVEQAFQQAFGQTKNNFYNIDFPGYLNSLRTSPIYLEQVGRLPQGSPSFVPAGSAAYELNFVAYGFEDLTQEQQGAAWILPPKVCGRGSELIGKMIVALCNASPGTYPIRVQMPDGRSAQIGLNHSDALPTLTPVPTRTSS